MQPTAIGSRKALKTTKQLLLHQTHIMSFRGKYLRQYFKICRLCTQIKNFMVHTPQDTRGQIPARKVVTKCILLKFLFHSLFMKKKTLIVMSELSKIILKLARLTG